MVDKIIYKTLISFLVLPISKRSSFARVNDNLKNIKSYGYCQLHF